MRLYKTRKNVRTNNKTKHKTKINKKKLKYKKYTHKKGGGFISNCIGKFCGKQERAEQERIEREQERIERIERAEQERAEQESIENLLQERKQKQLQGIEPNFILKETIAKNIKLKKYDKLNYDEKESIFWYDITLNNNFREYKPCKVIFMFDVRDINHEAMFIELSENKRKELMTNILFNNYTSYYEILLRKKPNSKIWSNKHMTLEYENFKYYICKNNNVKFYNETRLNALCESLKFNGINLGEKTKSNFPTLNEYDIKNYLLELSCLWVRGRPEHEELLIDIMYGNIEPCSFDSETYQIKGVSRLITMVDKIWDRNPNYKEAYEMFLRQVYSK